jgi:hypothetical protein
VSEYFPTAVYLLCFLTSLACAWLLGRAYRRTSARVLLWSAACFALLAGNNLLLMIDLLLMPRFDLILLRHLLSLAAVATLIFGFVWDLRE